MYHALACQTVSCKLNYKQKLGKSYCDLKNVSVAFSFTVPSTKYTAQSLEYHPVQLTVDQSKNLKELAS